jgi:hypothetical protein
MSLLRSNLRRLVPWLTPLSACAAAVTAQAPLAGFEMHAVDGVVGWRVDRASLGVCGALSDRASFGYGLAKFRQVNIAEFGVRAEAQLTNHWRGNVAIAYGYVANGHVTDSGLCDMNSNPFNSRSWSYTSCCTPCSCQVDPKCSCSCTDLTPRALALTTARLRGNTWDLLATATYDFRPIEGWRLGLGMNWEYNWQRYRLDQAIWGPLGGSLVGVDCFGQLGPDFVVQEPGDERHYALTTPLQVTHEIAGTSVPGNPSGGGCLALGYCFNGTTYRASWNMGMASAQLDWQMEPHWEWTLLYRIGFGAYTGKFETLGGANSESCSCDLCPSFLEICGSDLAHLKVTPVSFTPSTMRASAAAFGQDVRLLTTWRCDFWRFGADFTYLSRRTMSCTDIEPCVSCTSICNGALEEGGSQSHPIWSDATLSRASWNSWQVHLFAGYAF